MDEGRALAESLWGAEAVAEALVHPAPALLDAALRAEIRRRLTNDAELASWGRTLDAATFAALVRLVSGETRRELQAAPPRRRGH